MAARPSAFASDSINRRTLELCASGPHLSLDRLSPAIYTLCHRASIATT